MSETIPVELPEDLLVEALRRLPPARRHELMNKLVGEPRFQGQAVPAATLDELTALSAVGGDAFQDSEKLYDDARGA